MLSLSGSNGYCWLGVLCKAIQQGIDPDGHDHDDSSVLQLFAEGEDWARSKGIPIPDGDHAKAFIAARNNSQEPVIPEYMRLFCAEQTKTKVAPAVTSKTAQLGPISSGGSPSAASPDSVRTLPPARMMRPPRQVAMVAR